MKIRVEKLGILRKAEFELGDLTIICGKNNTGKTYATYALYGFLMVWNRILRVDISSNKINELIDTGVTRVDLVDQAKRVNSVLKDGCKKYSKVLRHVFASKETYFKDSIFELEIPMEKVLQNTKDASFKWKIESKKTGILSLTKEKGKRDIIFSLLIDKKISEVPPVGTIQDMISREVVDILFGSIFPLPFIASAERTGAAIFRKELDFARNRLLEEMSRKDTKTEPIKLLRRSYEDYAIPIKKNVDFIRYLESISKQDGFLLKHHSNILNQFADIIGGEYIVRGNNILHFKPKNARVKLTMNESSSAVRSMLDIGFYLRHQANPSDLLMVDEPELNLHPENQRRIARLFARLVNLGIKVFITTHSDYIIKELNTLIMLNNKTPHLKRIIKEEGYEKSELMDIKKIKVYIAEKALVTLGKNKRKSRHYTLVGADIDQQNGIEVSTFDETINKMNEIQEDIIWGE